MKYKIGDRVRVTHSDHSWDCWMGEMDSQVGSDHVIVGEWEHNHDIHPTIIIEGYNRGLTHAGRHPGEYAFPEHCLKLAIKPGEQLWFEFMKDD